MKGTRPFLWMALILLLAACVPVPLTLTPVPGAKDLGTLAYVWGGDIWLKHLPDGRPKRVTEDGRNSEPRWSPSGRRLAFRKFESQLWLYSLETGEVAAVDQGAPVYAYRWSPVADMLAYVAGSGVLTLRAMTAAEGESGVVTAPSPAGGPGSFAWSPDGAQLAYVWSGQDAAGRYRQEIRLQPAGGGEALTLFAGGNPAVERTLGLAGWLPSGRGLLMWYGPRLVDSFLPEVVDLLVLPAGGGQPFTGEPTPYANSASRWLIGDLTPAPAGSAWRQRDAMALTVGDGPSWTGKRLYVAGRPSTPADQVAIQPDWSPDGELLAYSGMPDPGMVMLDQAGKAVRERHIWLADPAGKAAPRRLTGDPGYRDEHPQWLGDGSRLLFARLDASNRAALWLIPSGGGQPRLAVENLDVAGPTDDFKVQIEWDRSYGISPTDPRRLSHAPIGANIDAAPPPGRAPT